MYEASEVKSSEHLQNEKVSCPSFQSQSDLPYAVHLYYSSEDRCASWSNGRTSKKQAKDYSYSCDIESPPEAVCVETVR